MEKNQKEFVNTEKEYLQESSEVMKRYNTTENGISKSEAEKRLEENGPNKLEGAKKISIFRRFLGELKDPMTLILIAAAVVSGITAVYSNEPFTDVIIILTVVIINAVLGVFQETKAEKAIEALQKIAAATSKVIRGGAFMTVKSEELVVGDIVVLEAGDAVPADGRIIESHSLKIEEAALTGESVPSEKSSNVLTANASGDVPLGDRANMVYMGSTVVYGRGKAVITGTGMNTEMGKIAGAIAAATDGETPLQRKLSQLSKILSILVLVICIVIFAVDIFKIYPNVTGDALLETFMIAVSLAVAAVPEGLAAVVTVVLSIGVTNMAKRNAVIRKLTAVETLGCTQVICSDKTGTLTQNKMTVVEHFSTDENMLITGMALCSDAKLENGEAVGEPTECALVNDLAKSGLEKVLSEYERIGEAPFDSDRKMMSVVCKNGEKLIQYTKGAPDEVLKRCKFYYEKGQILPLTEEKKREILTQNKSMADEALRVLALSVRFWDKNPENNNAEYLETELCFVGLSGMIDPVRPEAVEAVSKCKMAGIRPIMITGDHKDTAVAIAKQLGILSENQLAITGEELNGISDDVLFRDIEKYSVYARVQPEHKVRIVNAWKHNGMITAMTGDGVNDAPAIKSADIGVGMGITGTDVTKNVADMVLTDDNFATIVSAVEEGRRIYDNIRKAIQFLLSSNLAEVLSIFTATMLGFTILKPIHLLWINLITDCFPALALGMEKSESDVMKRSPRKSNEGIFADKLGFDVAFQGVLITLITLASYFVGYKMGDGNVEKGMTMAFLTLSLVEIFHSYNMRSRILSIFSMKNQNLWLLGAMIGSFVLTMLVLFVPFLRTAFGLVQISALDLGIAVGLAVVIIPIMEIVKVIRRK
ncbi:MAG: calcium-translocating P-type ATPase, PMCA-type [Clostridia bacterium]|nr:calcium-translocating P-type ATPase, PMCA-type [Clostridia bacterium]